MSKTNASILAYVGEYGEYAVPPDVEEKARSMNGVKPLNDRRTKGARYIKWWGRSKDAEANLVEQLRKRHDGNA